MLNRRIALIALLLLSACQHGGRSNPSAVVALRDELLQMEADDQAVRERIPSTHAELLALDAEAAALSVRHTRRMKEILNRYGWPTHSLVGEDAAAAAWLLVQHADHDPAFQRRVLELMEPLAASGEVRSAHYAYLWDRTHEPQRYGTQGDCAARGVWEPREIETPSEVDTRRRTAGIFPPALSEYIQVMSGFCEERLDLEPRTEGAAAVRHGTPVDDR